MGVVYRAHDADLGRDVALKLVTAQAEEGESQGRARLLREAQALAQLSHPNIIAIFDVGRFDGGVFLAMELVQGQRLDEWLKSAQRGPRFWREVVQLFKQAGRGLEAAHAAGLVHRDFKPTNVMIGSDGRVRVLDFGLARPADPTTSRSLPPARRVAEDAPTAVGGKNDPTTDEEPITGPSSPPNQLRRDSAIPSSPSLLASPVTQVGAIVGTPPYMAPEQHLGAVGDAAADQFSFCISFYQALYGERPFEGSTHQELVDNIMVGKLRPTPPGAKVPSWVRQIVLRGLSPSPEQRWPSMTALLEALQKDPAIKWRRLGVGAAATALCGLAALGVTRGPWLKPCRGAEAQLHGIWDDARKQAVRLAFEKTGKPYAADAARAVERAVDGYARAWVDMHTDACEATRVRGVQSSELLDLRMECLSHRLDELKAQIDLFASADETVVERAPQAAQSLSPLSQCADAAALRAPVRPPSDPAVKKRVDDTRKQLAQVRALLETGHYPDGLKLATAAAAQAKQIGYRPVEAEALLYLGRLQELTGDYDHALQTLRDAGAAAEAGRDDLDAARAATNLVWVTGERLGKYPEAHELARDAQAKIERLGDAPALEADLDAKLGSIYADEGKYDEALKHSQHALEIRQKVLQKDDPVLATSLSDIGDIYEGQSKDDEAMSYYRRALTLLTAELGADHPLVANTESNLGAALRGKGRYDEALEQYRRAEEIVRKSMGPMNPTLATIYVNVGSILRAERKPDAALNYYQRALTIWTKALGAEHPNVGTVHFYIGSVSLQKGEVDDAQAQLRRALEIWEAALGKEHPSLSAALDGLGDVEMARKNPRGALAQYQRAATLIEKAIGPDHPDLAEALTGAGDAQLALKEPKRAIAPLERALAIRVKNGGDALDLARTRYLLAQALWQSGGDRARARALAQAAQTAYAANEYAKKETAEIEAWLKSHGAASE